MKIGPMPSSTQKREEVNDQLQAHNYCISFIDLLGQREALRGQGLLPIFKSDDDHKRFINTLKGSIGAILRLQSRANDMLAEGEKDRPDSKLRASLPPEKQTVWDEMSRSKVSTQRWSDGLVSFVSLGESSIKCPLNGVFNIFATAGTLCFMGLAACNPIRGAIDVAWGVELRPGELYGAAVAGAYEIESIYAQYPRIVVGPRAVGFLNAHKDNKENDVYSANNRALAELCLSFLAQDADGLWILNYLGADFRSAITHRHHVDLYARARKYVEAQLQEHQKTANSKLAFRYAHLLDYFAYHESVDASQDVVAGPASFGNGGD
jgi:hypothetical protein